MLAQIRRLIPQVNHANPLIAPLAQAAGAVAALSDRTGTPALAAARLELDLALATIFMVRGSAACAACWPHENTQATQPASEPAHAPQ